MILTPVFEITLAGISMSILQDIINQGLLIFFGFLCASLILRRVSSDMIFPLRNSLIFLRLFSVWCFPNIGFFSPFLASLIFRLRSNSFIGSAQTSRVISPPSLFSFSQPLCTIPCHTPRSFRYRHLEPCPPARLAGLPDGDAGDGENFPGKG